MTTFLLENPVRLGFTCFFLCLAVSIIWFWTKEARWKTGALIAPLVSILLLGINVSVQTEKEQIHNFLFGFLAQIEKQGLSGVVPHLSKKYDYAGLNYADFRKQLTGHLKQWKFGGIRILKWKYSRLGKNIRLEFRIKTSLLFGGYPRPIDPSTWKFRLAPSSKAKEWEIIQITPIELTLPSGGKNQTQLKQLIRRRSW